MKRLLFLALSMISFAASAATHHTHQAASGVALRADQIVAKNVAARGGLKAWRAVKTLTMTGRMEGGGKKNSDLDFVMKMKRPHMSRLELSFDKQTAIQVYNGVNGWKVRPFLGRGNEAEPFTPTETKEAAAWDELDGPLMNYASKGTRVSLQGTEKVEGHKAYKLLLTMKDGSERHVWIDAKSFLERKIDGEPRKLDGKMHDVAIYYRDYRKEDGLMVPHVFETVVDGATQNHKMTIDHIAVNKPMADALFANPEVTLAKTSYR